MIDTETRTPEDVAAHLGATVARLTAVADAFRERTVDFLHAHPEPHSDVLDPFIAEFALPAVTDPGLISGAGFVAAPGLVKDARWHLAWWLRRPTGTVRLATVDDPNSEQFRDYTTLEWWRLPAQTHADHLTGPYVDYLCTDDYTVTITSPGIVGEDFLGVTGIDVLVDHLERLMLPAMRALGYECTLVNASGRVVTSTSTRRDPGSILRLDGLADALLPRRSTPPGDVDAALPDGSRVMSCAGSTLSLVLAPGA